MNTTAPPLNPALLKLVRLFVQHRAALGEHQRLQSARDEWVHQKRELERMLAELRNRSLPAASYSKEDIELFTRRRERDLAKHEGALALVEAAVELLDKRVEEAHLRSRSANEAFRSLRGHLKLELEALGVDLQ